MLLVVVLGGGSGRREGEKSPLSEGASVVLFLFCMYTRSRSINDGRGVFFSIAWTSYRHTHHHRHFVFLVLLVFLSLFFSASPPFPTRVTNCLLLVLVFFRSPTYCCLQAARFVVFSVRICLEWSVQMRTHAQALIRFFLFPSFESTFPFKKGRMEGGQSSKEKPGRDEQTPC